LAEAFLLGLGLVAIAAFVLTTMSRAEIGRTARLLRGAGAGLLALAGVFLATRGLAPLGLAIIALSYFVWRRPRERISGSGGREAPRARSSAMTVEEAYQGLGLRPGASAEDVRRAYRDLIQKLHPDHGGTSYLAAKLNEARDLLLSRLA
jgi:hypothetical protein